MIKPAGVLGVVLAGGKSTRMGTDKSLLSVGGRPLISYSVRLLQSIFPRVIIVSDFSGKYEFLGVDIIPDLHKGIGPLGGIHAALTSAAPGAIFLASCDTPRIPSNLIKYLLGLESPLQTRIPRFEGYLQPLFGLYDSCLLSLVENHISTGNHRVTDFLETVSYLPVDITPDLPFFAPDMFSNVNLPQDYARLEQASE